MVVLGWCSRGSVSSGSVGVVLLEKMVVVVELEVVKMVFIVLLR